MGGAGCSRASPRSSPWLGLANPDPDPDPDPNPNPNPDPDPDPNPNPSQANLASHLRLSELMLCVPGEQGDVVQVK